VSALRVDILTLFPGAFSGPLDVSMLRRARETGLLEVALHDIRDHATDRHRSVDDYPFGGSQGMVMRVDVLHAALQHVQSLAEPPGYVIYLTPQGEPMNDRIARELAAQPRLVLVCGRYEGVDERFVEHFVDREISIGDYVLTGGELPAMVLTDAVARHIPGVLGDEASPHDESFADGLLEHPQYTRPAEYQGWRVPEVLLGGNHAEIKSWRREQRVERTRTRRPDRLPPLELGDTAPEKVGIPGVRVRSLRFPDDLPGVLELWRDAAPGIQLHASDEPAELAKKLSRDPELFLVAEQAGEIVGAVLGGFDGLRGDIHHLAVAEPHRGRGVARALLSMLERRLRALGCISIKAHVTRSNGAGEAFLERAGWQRSDVSVWIRDL
jgi:tRNA (guanine37-N1)-methyltransferase